MIKGKFNDEPDYTAQQALELARDVWAHLPGTGAIFFEGNEANWHANFDKYCFADLLNGLGLIAEAPQYQKHGDKIGKGVYYAYVDQATEHRLRNEFDVNPNCRERTHIGLYFCVWDFANACSKGTGDTCWLSRRVVGEHAGLSPTTAQRAIEWLVVHGWLEVVTPPKQGGKMREQRGLFRVISHDKWILQYGCSQCLMQKKQ